MIKWPKTRICIFFDNLNTWDRAIRNRWTFFCVVTRKTVLIRLSPEFQHSSGYDVDNPQNVPKKGRKLLQADWKFAWRTFIIFYMKCEGSTFFMEKEFREKKYYFKCILYRIIFEIAHPNTTHYTSATLT